MGMKDAQQNKRMLVLGATGTTVRRVVERLAARGLPTGWEDTAMWASALQNVGSVYVPYYSDLAVPAAADTVRSEAVSVEEFASALAQEGEPPEFTTLPTYLLTEVLDGRNAHLTVGV
jgi:hypothetical protein